MPRLYSTARASMSAPFSKLMLFSKSRESLALCSGGNVGSLQVSARVTHQWLSTHPKVPKISYSSTAVASGMGKALAQR